MCPLRGELNEKGSYGPSCLLKRGCFFETKHLTCFYESSVESAGRESRKHKTRNRKEEIVFAFHEIPHRPLSLSTRLILGSIRPPQPCLFLKLLFFFIEPVFLVFDPQPCTLQPLLSGCLSIFVVNRSALMHTNEPPLTDTVGVGQHQKESRSHAIEHSE